jgi:hypothetical protein
MVGWTIEEPTTLDIEEPVHDLTVRLVAGQVDVVPTDGPVARVEVSEVDHGPLHVSVEGGVLSIRHEKLSWDGVLTWLSSDRRRAVVSVAVPAASRATVAVVSANAVVAGLEGAVHVRCVSGDVTLDEVRGPVEVETVSGDVEGRGLSGEVRLKAVSGGLTIVDGSSPHVHVRNVSGDIALDLQPTDHVDIDVTTVSGDVTVRLPGDTEARVDLESMSGDLASAFEGLEQERRPGRRRLRGAIGAGHGAIHGKSVSGRVALLARNGRAE